MRSSLLDCTRKIGELYANVSLTRLGENQGLFVAFSQFLMDRNKANDFTGSFVACLLEVNLYYRAELGIEG